MRVVQKKLSKKTSREKFTYFMSFLKDAKEMTKYNISVASGSGKNLCFVTGTVLTQNNQQKQSDSSQRRGSSYPCIACNIDGATDLSSCMHGMGSCLVWGSLSHEQRLSMVK